MNLSNLQLDLYRRVGLPTSPASAVVTRLLAFLNEAQQEILSEPGLEPLLHDSITFASVASTPEYSLPQIVSRIEHVRDATNRRTLATMSESWYQALYPNKTAQTGLSHAWVDRGYSAIETQPSDASELFVISTSASDGATKSATVDGYLSDGSFRTVTVALNGVTAVSLGATITTWIAVTKFEIVLGAGGTTTAAGTVSLREDSGTGTILSRVFATGALAKYRRIALVRCPASAVTYTVDFEREVTDMVNATDEPVIPARFHRLLVTGARMKEYEKSDNTRYGLAKAEWDRGLKTMKFWLRTQSEGSPNLRGLGRYERPSRLGAWFPSLPW